jgi:hypothetical protein
MVDALICYNLMHVWYVRCLIEMRDSLIGTLRLRHTA